jgi:hypothetical protein
MSEINLLLFGCVVSFIAAAGAYVFMRERFTAGEVEEHAPEASIADGQPHEVHKVA